MNCYVRVIENHSFIIPLIKNILALERVQPIPLEYDEISVKLGSTWIPEDVYHQFCCELLDIQSWNKSR